MTLSGWDFFIPSGGLVWGDAKPSPYPQDDWSASIHEDDMGSAKEKVEPIPGTDVTHIRPP